MSLNALAALEFPGKNVKGSGTMKALVLSCALTCALMAGTTSQAADSVQRYDAEYPQIGYSDKPAHNAFVRLQQRLDKGEVKLEWKAPRGYLDSVLKALDIDPSSQSLVFSKTSLQIAWISEKTPRAIYFNDENYVAWVDGAPSLEMMGVDSVMGPVFYTLDNRNPAVAVKLDRETLRCLNCHDSFSLSGGGVPHFLMVSTNAGVEGDHAQRSASIDTTDSTPMRARWGGWYVTGHDGNQPHLGNIIIRSQRDLDNIQALRKPDIDTLKGLFDTTPYITDKSDVVALVILAHQVTIHNLITRANYKTRRFVAHEIDPAQNPSPTWEDFSPKMQKVMRSILDPLVRGLLNADAAPIVAPMVGNSGYDAWFEKQGPKDSRGRSLRELDLKTRLFKYPLSYLIYSDGFKGLPDYAKVYVYERIDEVLRGQDQSPAFAGLSATDRRAILEILTATDAAFAKVAATTTPPRPPGAPSAKGSASAAATAGGNTAAQASPSCAARESARPSGCSSSRS
jgi:hypothetical protein